ncbi:winged helix-turn-helix domain-containing protein, partial [Salmonella enterica subsp. enterica serovar Anatum]|nr:winged helix-turn-helix domain-containing protein [Salmonella enterica subsp. enterica serovar Anatum]
MGAGRRCQATLFCFVFGDAYPNLAYHVIFFFSYRPGCLRLLLENAPSVVSQQTFFQKVWEEDGMVVSANTLYQNISI